MHERNIILEVPWSPFWRSFQKFQKKGGRFEMTSKKEVVLTFSMFCQIRIEFRILAENRLKKRRSFGAFLCSVALQEVRLSWLKTDFKKGGRFQFSCFLHFCQMFCSVG
jgi:hypothetical protein